MLKNIFVLFLVSVLILGCSEKPFQLEYKFKQGDKLRYSLTTISNNTQSVIIDTTVTSSVEQTIIYLFEISIKEVDAEGNTEAEININSVKLNAKTDKDTFSFEAGVDNDTVKIKQFSEFYSLYNNPFNVRINKKGEIVEILKAENISNKFLELKGALGKLSNDEKIAVQKDLVDGVLKPFVTQVFRKVPNKELNKDSTWFVRQPPIPFMVYQINYTNTYKVVSVEKRDDSRVAVVEAGIKFEYSGESKVNERGIEYSFQEPISSAEGQFDFDIDNGYQLKSRTKTNLQITYTMEANTPQGKQKGKRSETVTSQNILELIK